MLSHRLDVKRSALPERAVERVTRVVPTAHLGVEGCQLADLPEKYLPSLVRSAELCAVKKHIQTPPAFKVYTKAAEAVDA